MGLQATTLVTHENTETMDKLSEKSREHNQTKSDYVKNLDVVYEV